MNTISITLQVRQLITSAEIKVHEYKNEVIIKEYRDHVEALKRSLEASVANRGGKG